MNVQFKKLKIPILILSLAILGSVFVIRLSYDYGLHYLKKIIDAADVTENVPSNETVLPENQIENESSSSESTADDSSVAKKSHSAEPAEKAPEKNPDSSSAPPKAEVPDDATDVAPEAPPKKHAIFGYMPVEDQSYLISISNRFTLTEINAIIDAYKVGDESWEASKALIRERVSPQEIERVRDLVYEYIL